MKQKLCVLVKHLKGDRYLAVKSGKGWLLPSRPLENDKEISCAYAMRNHTLFRLMHNPFHHSTDFIEIYKAISGQCELTAYRLKDASYLYRDRTGESRHIIPSRGSFTAPLMYGPGDIDAVYSEGLSSEVRWVTQEQLEASSLGEYYKAMFYSMKMQDLLV